VRFALIGTLLAFAPVGAADEEPGAAQRRDRVERMSFWEAQSLNRPRLIRGPCAPDPSLVQLPDRGAPAPRLQLLYDGCVRPDSARRR
jgi:hypothetical protein